MGLTLDRLAVGLATGLHLSYLPVKLFTGAGLPGKWTGAGFIGTLEGLALVPFLPGKPVFFSIFLVFSIVASSWLCGRAETVLGQHDDQRIVLDEVVGFWTAAAFLPRTLPVLAAVFVCFRALDSVKLPPYRWLEELPGGWGVVADDVGAAVIANLLVRILMRFSPWLRH